MGQHRHQCALNMVVMLDVVNMVNDNMINVANMHLEQNRNRMFDCLQPVCGFGTPVVSLPSLANQA